jgi:hypothetical protein
MEICRRPHEDSDDSKEKSKLKEIKNKNEKIKNKKIGKGLLKI